MRIVKFQCAVCGCKDHTVTTSYKRKCFNCGVIEKNVPDLISRAAVVEMIQEMIDEPLLPNMATAQRKQYITQVLGKINSMPPAGETEVKG